MDAKGGCRLWLVVLEDGLEACVCVCVCVCARARARARVLV